MASSNIRTESVHIRAGRVELEGELSIPRDVRGVVLFVHGSGSSRRSPRNQFVAQYLNGIHLATLLFDLLTRQEEIEEEYTRHLRFDIELLAGRLEAATDWIGSHPATAHLAIGYFGASTGGGAALVAAARRPDRVSAVVSRGGRPDLAGEHLASVRAATLLIVGGEDELVIEMNQMALARLGSPVKHLAIVPDATHLFEEPGTLEAVARLAGNWFSKYLPSPHAGSGTG
jgi:putative phosphoribosyl transferase